MTKVTLRRRAALAGLLAAPSLACGQTAAPIRLLVNGTPGSISDILCRTLAEGLRERLGDPSCRTTARAPAASPRCSGARQPADGSVLVQANIGVTALAPLVFRRPPIDPDAELAPICHLTELPSAWQSAPTRPVWTERVVARCRAGWRRCGRAAAARSR